MNLLIVCSGNKNRINSFISEQAAALSKMDITIHYFLVKGKGVAGYLKNMRSLVRTVRDKKIDIIHAHYGLSGMLAVLQRRIPVVITFHGSDINQPNVRRISGIASRLSHYNIVVEKGFVQKIRLKDKYSVLPCGVDFNTFQLLDKQTARDQAGFKIDEDIVLFSSSFDNPVKNYSLAKEAVDKVPGARLIELSGYNREQINILMNAADVLLLTSFSEGSPQVVKEALACNLPVVATPVGDVPELLNGVKHCYVTDYNSHNISLAIQSILSGKPRSNGRTKISGYDNTLIAQRLTNIYKSLLTRQHA